MSMHNIPLTPVEEAGLKAHGLDIGTPSQLSDVFRQGVAWGQKVERAGIIRLCDHLYSSAQEFQRPNWVTLRREIEKRPSTTGDAIGLELRRLRQYVGKASFSSSSDKHSALACLEEIQRLLESGD